MLLGYTTLGVLVLIAAIVAYFRWRPLPQQVSQIEEIFSAGHDSVFNWIEVRCRSRIRLNDRSATFIETDIVVTGRLDARPILRWCQIWQEPVPANSIVEAIDEIDPTRRVVLAKIVQFVTSFRQAMPSFVRVHLILRDVLEEANGEYFEYSLIRQLVNQNEMENVVFSE